MSKPSVLLVFAIMALIGLCGCTEDHRPLGYTRPDNYGIAGDDQLAGFLEDYRAANNIPAIACETIYGDSVLDQAAVGYRAMGLPEKVTLNDQWHLGSISKSMTATLFAIYVENGIFTWETTIGDIFPEYIETMHEDYVDVSLKNLLTHTSGFAGDIEFELASSLKLSGDPMMEQRRRFFEAVIDDEPAGEVGDYLYSNTGYVVAGAMLEKVKEDPWEVIMYRNFLGALHMNSTGFGAPGIPGLRDQPLGHTQNGSSWTPIFDDNPAFLGPAGTVHSTLSDIAKYLIMHKEGAQGQPDFLTQTSFDMLHTPAPGTDYAMGWIVRDPVLLHDGSNTLWYAVVTINATEDLATAIFMNCANEFIMTEAITDIIDILNSRYQAFL